MTRSPLSARFNQPGDELADAVSVLAEDVIALRLAHLLEDDLLRRLGRNASEHVRGLVELDLAPESGGAIRPLGLFERDLGLGVGDFVSPPS